MTELARRKAREARARRRFTRLVRYATQTRVRRADASTGSTHHTTPNGSTARVWPGSAEALLLPYQIHMLRGAGKIVAQTPGGRGDLSRHRPRDRRGSSGMLRSLGGRACGFPQWRHQCRRAALALLHALQRSLRAAGRVSRRLLSICRAGCAAESCSESTDRETIAQ